MIDRKFISDSFFKLARYEEMRDRTYPALYFRRSAKAIKFSTNIEYLGNGRVHVITNYGNLILGETTSQLFLEMDKDKICSRLIEYEKSYGPLDITEEGEGKRISFDSAKTIVNYINSRIDLKKSESKIDFTYEVTGSFRREKETIGDLDYVVTNFEEERRDKIIGMFMSMFERSLVSGTKKIAGIIKGIQVDIRFVESKEYPCMLMHSTGPKEFNILMRRKANSLGYKLNEYCVTDSSGNSIYPESEKQIFEILSEKYVKPNQR